MPQNTNGTLRHPQRVSLHTYRIMEQYFILTPTSYLKHNTPHISTGYSTFHTFFLCTYSGLSIRPSGHTHTLHYTDEMNLFTSQQLNLRLTPTEKPWRNYFHVFILQLWIFLTLTAKEITLWQGTSHDTT